MNVTVIGNGEAFDELLPNTSLLVRSHEATILLDCGYSVPPHVFRTEPDADAIDLIYLSHAHADHYFGMPGLLGRMWDSGRTKPLVIMAQAAVLDAFEQVMTLGYRNLRSRFQFDLQLCPVDAEEPASLFGLTFRFAETVHSARNLAIRIEGGGPALCYSGDGAITESSRELARGAALWVQEAFSYEPMPSVHAHIGDVLESAAAVHAGRVALVHMSRHVRRERTRLFETMLTAPAGCVLPEVGRVFEL